MVDPTKNGTGAFQQLPIVQSRVRDYMPLWPLVTALVMVVAWAVVAERKAAGAVDANEKQERKLENHESRLTTTESAVLYQKETQKEIKDSLKAINDKLDKINDRMAGVKR